MRLLVLLFFLILIPIASADVQIDINDTFRITNADINFSSNQTYDYFDVGSNYIDFGNGIFIITPTGQINITILQWESSGLYTKKFNESNTVATNTQYTIGGLPTVVYFNIYKNSTLYSNPLADNSGYFSFNNVGGFNNVSFYIYLSETITSYRLSGCRDTANWGAIGMSLIIVLFVAMAGSMAISWLGGGMSKEDSKAITHFVWMIGVVVVISLISIAIVNPIFNAMGC